MHQMAEIGVDSSLIPVTGCLQPRHDIHIKPDRHGGLLGPVEPADHGIRRNLPDFRGVGQVDFAVRPGGELLKLLRFSADSLAIEPPFLRGRATGRDDADHLFRIHFPICLTVFCPSHKSWAAALVESAEVFVQPR